MDFLTPHFLSGLISILIIDLVLAADNAVAIAMAARNLSPKQRKQAIAWGAGAAAAIRIVLTIAVVYLLQLPALKLVGGVLLLPVAWHLLQQGHDDDSVQSAKPNSIWRAVASITVADALMGLDNVLGVAGAADGHMGLVITGLVISIPLVMFSASLILRLMQRFPIIVYIGAGTIVFTAARMIMHDRLVANWFEAHDIVREALTAALVIVVLGGYWLLSRRRRHRADT